jgi:hypothetical protein
MLPESEGAAVDKTGPTAVPSPDRAAPAAVLGADRFLTFKTVTAFDAVRLRVPAIWDSAYDEKAGMWCCCRDGIDEPAEDDSGTLWIDGSTVALTCPAAKSWTALERIAEASLEKAREKPGYQPASGRVDRTADGVMLRYVYRAREKGEPLVFNRWHLYVPVGQDCHIVHYSLVVTEPTAHRAPWQALVAAMDREVRAAELNLPGMTGGPRR